MVTTWTNVLNGAATTVGATPGDAVPATALADVLQISNSGTGLDTTLRDVGDGDGTTVPLKVSTSAVMLPKAAIWPYGDSTFFSAGQTGIMIPYYIYPNNPYSDVTVTRLLGLIRQYRGRVPVIVIVNPNSGPGSVMDGNYAAFIKLIQAAGGKVAGYISSAYGVRAEALVKADIDTWLTLYAATPPDTIFIDEQSYDLGTNNANVALYKRYTDYCHARNLAPVISNPGTNQREEYFAERTGDIIVVAETGTWPTESDMLGAYVGGHIDYKTSLRAALVYGQTTLDPASLRTLIKYVQWVYVTADTLSPNPWDSLSGHLEQTFALLAGRDTLNATVDFGIVGDGTDVRAALLAAMNAAVAANKWLELPYGTYGVGSVLLPPSGLRLRGIGNPTIKYIGATSSDCVRLQSVTNVEIEGVRFDNDYDASFSNGNSLEINGSSNIRITRCTILNSADGGVMIQNTCSEIHIEDCDISDTPTQEGIGVYDSSRVYVRNCRVNRNAGFGVVFWSNVVDSEISGCQMISNGLEGVGLRYTNTNVLIADNYIYGSGDNGISVTGQRCVVSGNRVYNCYFHGICSFGDNNVIVGNNCWNNGQGAAGATTFQSGIAVRPGFGGRGSYNTITGNVVGDNQAVATQRYGVSISAHLYTTWANGQSISGTQVYRVYNDHYYEAQSAGTTATGSEPVHTSGTVAGADTIQWKYIATNASGLAANYDGNHNRIASNAYSGNGTADSSIITSAQRNQFEQAGIIYLPVPDGSAVTSNWTAIVSTNLSPAGNITGTPGMIALRRSGSVAGRGLYVYSDNWFAVLERRSGVTASRTTGLGASDPGMQYFDTTLGKPIWWSGTAWVDATGAAV